MLCFFRTEAQEKESDVYRKYSNLSATIPLKDLKQADTAVIANQINYAITIIFSSPDSAAFLFEDALIKSRYLHYNTGIATALCDLAYYNNNLGNYNTSKQYYREGLPYALGSIGHSTSMAMYYSAMSTPYFHSAQYDSMSYYAYKAEALILNRKIKTTSEAIDIAGVYCNIGMLWAAMGNYLKAQSYLQKSSGVLLAHRPDTSKKNTAALYYTTLSQIYSNTGQTFQEQKKEDSALTMYYIALHYDDGNLIAKLGISKMLAKHGMVPAAFAMLKEIITLAECSHNYPEYIHAKCAYGLLLYRQKQYKEAREVLSETLESQRSGLEMDLLNIYETYHALADIKRIEGNYT
ncbi:tetratricopeptide repeat protein [Chitinophagaceae bacterium MMS25-I14]